MNTAIPLVALTSILTGSIAAQTTFTFHTGDALGDTGTVFDNASGATQHTVDGITLTAEAYLNGVSTNTKLNGNSTSFGIDNPGTDASESDDADRFDNHGGSEAMVFSFDRAGTFQSIDLRFIEENTDEAQLIFAGGPTYELNLSTDTGGSTDTFNIAQVFTAGQTITLQLSPNAEIGENFALESFTVVPAPETFSLLAGLCGLTMVMLRRRREV